MRINHEANNQNQNSNCFFGRIGDSGHTTGRKFQWVTEWALEIPPQNMHLEQAFLFIWGSMDYGQEAAQGP